MIETHSLPMTLLFLPRFQHSHWQEQHSTRAAAPEHQHQSTSTRAPVPEHSTRAAVPEQPIQVSPTGARIKVSPLHSSAHQRKTGIVLSSTRNIEPLIEFRFHRDIVLIIVSSLVVGEISNLVPPAPYRLDDVVTRKISDERKGRG